MKKLTLTILSLFLINSLMFAQIYFRAGGGYALPLATESIGEKQFRQDEYTGNNTKTTNTSENVSASYGSGINFNAGGGYMFSEYLGIDLNVSYLNGKKFETSDIYRIIYPDGSAYSDETTTTTNSKALFVTPSLVVTSGGKNAPYGRFGIVVGMPKIKGEESYYYDMDGTDTGSRKWEYTGGVSAGFQGAVGMNWGIGNNLKLYTEVNFTSMTFYPKEYNLTESINDGASNLDQTIEYYKKTEFVKKIDNTIPIDYTKPRQELRQGTPFSSISLQVGIVYSFVGKSM